MPMLFIHATNSEFASRDSGLDYDRPEDAMAIGVQSAVAMAADEIQAGHSNAAVEVSIEQEDGTPILRSVVVLSVSKLMNGADDLEMDAI